LPVPESVTADQLDADARAQLNSLPNDLADSIARYLVAAGLEEDTEKAYAYTQAAKRLAARVGVVREAAGIAAYQTGRWAEALAELRAARRMSGGSDYLPLMADAERGLGRLDRALALVREADVNQLDRATQIELRIVESGIRRDQGLADAAILVLQVPELTSGRARPWSARLFYAHAEALLAAGRDQEARNEFARAVDADVDGETDADDRLDELDGVTFQDMAEGYELADAEADVDNDAHDAGTGTGTDADADADIEPVAGIDAEDADADADDAEDDRADEDINAKADDDGDDDSADDGDGDDEEDEDEDDADEDDELPLDGELLEGHAEDAKPAEG
jgi:tetratricopeptide (TPR) repeat protein